jgi:hypothetical protein
VRENLEAPFFLFASLSSCRREMASIVSIDLLDLQLFFLTGAGLTTEGCPSRPTRLRLSPSNHHLSFFSRPPRMSSSASHGLCYVAGGTFLAAVFLGVSLALLGILLWQPSSSSRSSGSVVGRWECGLVSRSC